MAVPKKKTSPMKRDQRRKSHKFKTQAYHICPNCQNPKRPHYICLSCGHYAGRLVIN